MCLYSCSECCEGFESLWNDVFFRTHFSTRNSYASSWIYNLFLSYWYWIMWNWFSCLFFFFFLHWKLENSEIFPSMQCLFVNQFHSFFHLNFPTFVFPLPYFLQLFHIGLHLAWQVFILCKVSVQFSHLVMSNSLRPHESKHARPPCPSPTPGVYSDSYPSSRWCHPAISSSVIPVSSCPRPLPASGSFPVSQLFA